MYRSIFSFLLKQKIINTNYFGFCSNQSNEHTLIYLIETINKPLDNYEVVSEAFIDLK